MATFWFWTCFKATFFYSSLDLLGNDLRLKDESNWLKRGASFTSISCLYLCCMLCYLSSFLVLRVLSRNRFEVREVKSETLEKLTDNSWSSSLEARYLPWVLGVFCWVQSYQLFTETVLTKSAEQSHAVSCLVLGTFWIIGLLSLVSLSQGSFWRHLKWGQGGSYRLSKIDKASMWAYCMVVVAV